MALDVAVNAYLDVNLMLALVICLWYLSRMTFSLLGLGQAFLLQSRLLQLGMVFTLLAPLLSAALSGLRPLMAGVPNLSDLLLAQYLSGNIDISAASMDRLLTARQSAVDGMLGGTGDLPAIIGTVIAIGAAATLLRLVLRFVCLNTALAGCWGWRRSRRVDLLVSDTVSVPYSTRGLVRRYVVIPSFLLTRHRDLVLTLRHEFQHLRQGDVEWEMLLNILQPLFFWNPAFYLWKREFDGLRESACDQAVLRQNGDAGAYADCLLRVCEELRGSRTLWQYDIPKVALVPVSRLGLCSGRAVLRRRIERLWRPAPGAVRLWSVGVVAGLIAAGVTLGTLALRDSGDWSHDRVMLSSIVNLERLEQRNGPVPSLGQRP